ncbi:MAG: emopamil-binding family protein [Polyangia bacterium]
MASTRQPIPLKRRPLDMALLGFFAVNLLFVTYVISLEQIVIDSPFAYAPPAWPPRPLLTVIHWWEKTFDPLLWARPAWYRATIWLDVLVFGPFYAVALYAFGRGRDWIRIPSIIWASIMFTNVFIILFDELRGAYASPHPAVVVMANAAWLLVPFVVVWRLRKEHPFTEEVAPSSGSSA